MVTDNQMTDRAKEKDSVEHVAQDPRQDAGQDETIEKRLEKDPGNEDAQLDRGLDESMDASDPPSATQPVLYGGQLVFQKEGAVVRWLHNQTCPALQRRLAFHGLPMVLLPVRVY